MAPRLCAANGSIVRQYAVLDAQVIEEAIDLFDVRQGITRQYSDGTKTDVMVDQVTYIGAHRAGARPTLRINSLIAVEVERDADIVEKSSLEERDVPVRENGEIGLHGIHVF